MSINNNEDSSLRQRLNLTAPTGEQLYLTQLSTGAVLNAEGSDNSIDIIGEETNYNNPAIRLMSGTIPILNIFREKVECNKRIYMNNKPIYLKTLNTNHSIVYSSYNMDGVQISGFGDSTIPFFRLRSSNGDNYVMEAFTGKLNIYKHLFLENNLNVSGATRFNNNNIRMDNLYSHLPYLDFYTGDTTGPNDSLHNYNSKIRFFRTSIERAAVAYYAGGDSILIYNKEGDIGLSAHSTGAEGGRIDLKSNGTIELKSVSNNIILNTYDNGIKFYKKIQWYDGTSEKGYARFADGNFEIQSNGCDLVLGKRGSTSSKTIAISNSAVKMYEPVLIEDLSTISSNDDNTDDRYMLHLKTNNRNSRLCIESDSINNDESREDSNPSLLFRQDGGNIKAEIGLMETNHLYIHHKDGNQDKDWSTIKFFVGSATKDDGSLKMSIARNDIKMYKPLYMNSTTAAGQNRPIYLHTDENFYIKYNNDSSAEYPNGPNVTEIKGFEGVHLGSSTNTSMNLKVERDRVYITKMQVVDYINLENNHIRLRGFNDPSQIIGYAHHNENGKNVTIDGWIIRGWNGSRLSSCMGSNPNLSQTHAAWFISNSQPRFGGPYGYDNYSDDRIKFEENTITDGLSTIMKLNPVLYKKCKNIGDTDLSTMKIESGFVAQEVYNNVPEMRHLVDFDKSLSRNFVDGDLNGNCVTDIYSKKTDSDGVTEEKPEVCTICYDEMIPFTVKAIQELNALVNTLQSTVNNLNQQIETQNTIISELQSKIP